MNVLCSAQLVWWSLAPLAQWTGLDELWCILCVILPYGDSGGGGDVGGRVEEAEEGYEERERIAVLS